MNANIFIALLVEKLILTEKEGKALADKIGTAMLPSDYREAQKLLKKILNKI